MPNPPLPTRTFSANPRDLIKDLLDPEENLKRTRKDLKEFQSKLRELKKRTRELKKRTRELHKIKELRLKETGTRS